MTQHRRARAMWTGVLAVSAASALLLAGCSGDSGGDSGAQEFTFTFATSNNLESPYQKLANDYMAANPDVTITTNPTPNDKYGETVRTQLQAGNASDVIQTTPGSGDARGLVGLAEAGFLEPLGDTATSLVPSGSESLFQVDGKTYGQPLDFTIGSVVASLGNPFRMGVTDFTWPENMTDLYASCDTFAAAGGSLFAVAGAAPPNTGLMTQAIAATRVYAETPDWNQQRIDGKVTFADSKGWIDTLQTVIDLKDAGCFQAGVEGGGFDAITNGLSGGTSVGGFIPSGAAIEIAAAAPPEANFQVEPFPAEDGGKPFILASTNYTLSINAASEHKDAATKFLEWMASDEAQQKYYEYSGELPVSAYQQMDLTGTIYEPIVGLLADGSYTTLPNNVWPNPAVYDALGTGVQGLLTGQKSIDDVLSAMDAAWDQ
ncbi:MAG: extracellular solute-binding protein [Actinomycetales bacterium]|nr:extracellular solute-binding protein [Actinomycetales bacterium]